MVRSMVSGVLVVFAVLVVVRGSATAAPPPKQPASAPVWDWVIYDEKDKEVAKGHFVVRNTFDLYNGNGKKVGSYKDVGTDMDHVKVTISEGQLKGKIDLLKDKEKSSDEKETWNGEIENDKGGKSKVVLTFKKFRR